ncbi:DNA (cytosine-5-)-methyltransferase [Pseudoflavonifractor phocaeensis]|uniref:DNA (cytosine-5-)-methyltransferase n=1 Tax=Pseudoflavonifractor phocaeensis TaxID=1870988 RepID=UPI00210DDD2B|nr:DNA (cytosine-5-)-methyltransferase [Pseudoflavonifractor phocaeensis]MCQ4863546.1 DNA (cytosine-5-)-methyltransferase [Pseudoflavonifractor phocaeensis]
MAINYRRLWKLLIDLNLKKTDLTVKAGLSSSTIAKLSQNKIVQSDVLDRICIALDCRIEDIMEIERDTSNSINTKTNSKRLAEQRYSIVSLFAGCGGLDLGFRGGFSFLGKEYHENPFDIIWANEINRAACATYRANVDLNIVEGSIEEQYFSIPPYADVVIGGFPCQDISINGKMAGVAGKRSGLYVWMVKAVSQLRPKVFIAENVKALLMKRHEKSLRQVIEDFSAIGYDVSYHLYDAADYSVPQTRERVVIVGVRKDIETHFVPPKPTTATSHVTAKTALEDLESQPENPAINHIWSAAKPSSGQGLRYLTADKPATTMRSECHGNIQLHYCLPRRISMREAARLQSFPDSFIFQAKIRETERMVGNAVPPVFAWHIAQAVLNVLQNSGN